MKVNKDDHENIVGRGVYRSWRRRRARAREPDPERKPHKIKREPGRKREKCMERCVL